MKKYLVSLVVSFMLFPAAADARSLADVLAATDPALAAAARMALQDELPAPEVPAPAESSKAAAGPQDYAPFHRGGVYTYEYTSSEFSDSRMMQLEFGAFSVKDNSVTVTKTVFNNDTAQSATFLVYLTPNGIQADGSPLAGARLEMPSRLAHNQAWEEGADRSRVAAANTSIRTASGNYTGCVRIITRLAGGSDGTINRYYAPGVGLVVEQLSTRGRQEMISLVSYQLR
ncbi:MAG: hypothetical protein A2234_07455 [Elusimicrobia bacterium RIFOXYA2_FULL_58_8]|nr:MAG: hypothetical protein A2234_07455 [Elusimicrobia bacterium RIFOXYA2_FULL_58_8]OGS13705.1 MAG: hypothetical protein A2285_01220 [Elusimicrobia bacterium RIFOXYA12_FULL_57_11]